MCAGARRGQQMAPDLLKLGLKTGRSGRMNLSPLQELCLLLTSEPSLQTLLIHLYLDSTFSFSVFPILSFLRPLLLHPHQCLPYILWTSASRTRRSKEPPITNFCPVGKCWVLEKSDVTLGAGAIRNYVGCWGNRKFLMLPSNFRTREPTLQVWGKYLFQIFWSYC